MPLDLTQLVQDCHAYAKKQGFWEVPVENYVIPAKLMLIVSEVAEAMEADRTNEGAQRIFRIAEELADIIIRVCDLAGFLGIDLATQVEGKRAYNKSRPKLHGKAY